jgi:hypothetical protein
MVSPSINMRAAARPNAMSWPDGAIPLWSRSAMVWPCLIITSGAAVAGPKKHASGLSAQKTSRCRLEELGPFASAVRWADEKPVGAKGVSGTWREAAFELAPPYATRRILQGGEGGEDQACARGDASVGGIDR